jgi:hypothetical protein
MKKQTTISFVYVGFALCTALIFANRSVAQTHVVGHMEFQNAPIEALAEFLPQLTHKPVVVSQRVVGPFSYTAAQGSTSEQALKEIQAQLWINGCLLTNVGGAYYKLLPAAETNEVRNSPHVEIVVRDDSITVNGHPVPFESVAATVTGSLTPDTEVWVCDATRPTWEKGNGDFMSVFVALQNGLRPKFRWGKIYRLYLPKTASARVKAG